MRGINDPIKQQRLKLALQKFSGSIMRLLETCVRRENQQAIINKILLGWNCINNYAHAELDRIWILYNHQMQFQVNGTSKQVIHCHIYSESLRKYFFPSTIYASNNDIEKRALARLAQYSFKYGKCSLGSGRRV